MDDAASVLERYLAAWNDQDAERLADVYEPDAERVSPLGTARGREAVRQHVARLWRAAPDSRIEIKHWAATGSVVLYEFTDEGTHTGPLALGTGELMGTGRHFRIEGAGVFEFRNGRIAAERVYFDPAPFLSQLGLGR